jgi:DNA-binding MarR family transcriptional regulator
VTSSGTVRTKTQQDETVAIANQLRLSATRLARRLRQESDAGLTPSQLSALAAIDRHGPLTLGALAEVERVAPPSVTKAVAKLEGEGWVERQVDEADRRVTWVSLTPTGASNLAKIRQRRNVWLAARLAALDEDQRRRLADALDVLDELTAEAP